jgi:hypothetical protein
MEKGDGMKEQEKPRAVRLLHSVFKSRHSKGEKQEDFSFHMLDAMNDIRAFVRLIDRPDRYDLPHAKEVINGLLYHAPGHLAAAARLYDQFFDPFLEEPVQRPKRKPRRRSS